MQESQNESIVPALEAKIADLEEQLLLQTKKSDALILAIKAISEDDSGLFSGTRELHTALHGLLTPLIALELPKFDDSSITHWKQLHFDETRRCITLIDAVTEFKSGNLFDSSILVYLNGHINAFYEDYPVQRVLCENPIVSKALGSVNFDDLRSIARSIDDACERVSLIFFEKEE
ncbi:hypothetical protein PCE1_004408 [Barthelona sp. PCE]